MEGAREGGGTKGTRKEGRKSRGRRRKGDRGGGGIWSVWGGVKKRLDYLSHSCEDLTEIEASKREEGQKQKGPARVA